MAHEGKGEEAGEGHNAYAADLDEEHDDDMPGVRKCRGHVDCRQPGYTDGGGRDEQGVHKMNAMDCCIRQHQQPGADQDDEHKTKQEQQRRLDMALQQRERLSRQVDNAQQQQKEINEQRFRQETEVGQRPTDGLFKEYLARQHGKEEEVDADVEIQHLFLYDLLEFKYVTQRNSGKECQQEVHPARLKHIGDVGRILEPELVDQDEEGGERGNKYDPFGYHIQQAFHIGPVHTEREL